MNNPFFSMSLIMSSIVLGLYVNAVMSYQSQRSAAEHGRRESGDAAVSKPAGRLIPLAESLSPLQDHFNADADRRRVLLILSPT